MYLKNLQINSFRSFDEGTIELQKDLTVFVGENNGGKSNAIDAIRLLTIPLSGRREIYCEQTDVRFQGESEFIKLAGCFSELSIGQQGSFWLLELRSRYSLKPHTLMSRALNVDVNISAHFIDDVRGSVHIELSLSLPTATLSDDISAILPMP